MSIFVPILQEAGNTPTTSYLQSLRGAGLLNIAIAGPGEECIASGSLHTSFASLSPEKYTMCLLSTDPAPVNVASLAITFTIVRTASCWNTAVVVLMCLLSLIASLGDTAVVVVMCCSYHFSRFFPHLECCVSPLSLPPPQLDSSWLLCRRPLCNLRSFSHDFWLPLPLSRTRCKFEVVRSLAVWKRFE